MIIIFISSIIYIQNIYDVHVSYDENLIILIFNLINMKNDLFMINNHYIIVIIDLFSR